MAGAAPDEGDGRRGRPEPTDADVQRQWEEITAGLADLAGLGSDEAGPPDADDGHDRSGAATTDDPGSGGPDQPSARQGRSPSSPTPDADSAPGRGAPSSEGGPPRIGDLPLSSPGAGSAGPRDYDVPEDEEQEGYTPPEPPPIGPSDPLPTLAWLMALGGPIVTLLLLIFWTTAPGWLYLSAVAASLAGWLVLFWRMPRGRRDSGDDNGAVL